VCRTGNCIQVCRELTTPFSSNLAVKHSYIFSSSSFFFFTFYKSLIPFLPKVLTHIKPNGFTR